jgi:hypothetical protein
MTEEERSAWLAATRTRDPALADRLEGLLYDKLPAGSKGVWSVLPVPGQMFGVYTLLAQAGAGGMSTVWLAERNDGRFERRVAVKFLNIALIGKDGEDRFLGLSWFPIINGMRRLRCYPMPLISIRIFGSITTFSAAPTRRKGDWPRLLKRSSMVLR